LIASDLHTAAPPHTGGERKVQGHFALWSSAGRNNPADGSLMLMIRFCSQPHVKRSVLCRLQASVRCNLMLWLADLQIYMRGTAVLFSNTFDEDNDEQQTLQALCQSTPASQIDHWCAWVLQQLCRVIRITELARKGNPLGASTGLMGRLSWGDYQADSAMHITASKQASSLI